MQNLLNTLVGLAIKTPFYPHWLEFRKLAALRSKMSDCLYGDVLEVGAGFGDFKQFAISRNINIKNYYATDYSDWDEAFEQKSSGFYRIIDLMYMRKKRVFLDRVCSALELPYENNSFDWHVSSEVIEHISSPYKFFSEAARVIRPGGGVIMTAPFLYRIHPNKESDFFRILPGGYVEIARLNGLSVELVATNSGFGTTIAALVNQYLIRICLEQKQFIFKITAFLLLPLIFLSTNLFGWLIDGFGVDERFATRYLIIFRKN